MVSKYLYFFGANQTEGNGDLYDLLGGKGANLAEMSHLGIQVPPGFTISTEVCSYYFDHKNNLPPDLWKNVLPLHSPFLEAKLYSNPKTLLYFF